MHRQDFFHALLGAGLSLTGSTGCAARTTAPLAAQPGANSKAAAVRRAPITAICFDLFTLFDPRSVVDVARTVAPTCAEELCGTWRVRQFEYSWLRAAAGQYRDFRSVTGEALEYAAEVHGVHVDAQQKERLIRAYSQLALWPDTLEHLERFKRDGLRLAPLANYSPQMLEELLSHAGITHLFDAQLSTDLAQTFKPDPRAYALGVQTFGPKDRIAFCAFGGWDALGATWFGYPTFWLNRLGVNQEQITPAFDATGPTLVEFTRFVEGWA
jgi:2-haloacid dehalogenase